MKKNNGIKRIAVENFLSSLSGMSVTDAFANLRSDARSYGWNAATVNAIAEGISKHYAGGRGRGTSWTDELMPSWTSSIGDPRKRPR